MNILELFYLQIVQEKCTLLDFSLDIIDYMQKNSILLKIIKTANIPEALKHSFILQFQ